MSLTRLLCSHCGEPQTFDHVLEMAKKELTDLPYPFIKAVVSSILDRQARAPDGQISVTDVIGCPRAKYLRVTEDYYEKPEGLMAAFRGQLIHQLLAQYAQSEAVVETRNSREYRGFPLYGTADSVITSRANGRYRLTDWKTTKKIPQYGPWQNHIFQCNLYRFVFELPTALTDMRVVYFDLNGGEVAVKPVRQKDVWSDDKVAEFLDKRFIPIAESLRDGRRPLYRDVPGDILSWACSWCPVYDSCLKHLMDEPGAVPIFAEYARKR